MLALLMALSISFAGITEVYAEEDVSVEQPTQTEIEEYEQLANEAVATDDMVTDDIVIGDITTDPQPDRSPVDVITDSEDSWYSTETGLANVREIAGLKPTGYNVLQGSCSNGKKFMYFAFMSKANEKVKIIRMKWDNEQLTFSKSSGVIENYHGNGMTYVPNINGNDKIFITNAWSGHTNHITVLDAKTMTVENDIISKYWNKSLVQNCEMIYRDGTEAEDQLTLSQYIKEYGKRGFSGIAFDKVNRRLVASTCTNHDLIIFNIETDADGNISLIPQKFIVEDRDESVIQDIDCDENYIYMTWSGNSNVGGNRICIYDWNGENVKNYVADYWYEMEGLFHTGSGDSAQFYASYHHAYQQKVEKITKKKVKDKKVWNKDHTKKVWKYKTKKVKTVETYIYRNGYLRKLGNLTVAQ